MADRERILIVDDQPENISIMIEALQASYDLMAATDGETALERANGETRPDLILLDVLMPGMNGHDVCRFLKAEDATRDIPVIFVTALDKPDDEAKGLELGAVDYITKPISPPVVEARVRAHLQVTQARRVLLHQNETLENRVREKAADVIRMQQERVEGLNNFANAVAHQIRNPVMSIGGMAGLLVKKADVGTPMAEYAQAVYENSVRLENLVNVISEYVSLTADKTEEVSIRSVVEEAVALVKPLADESECAVAFTLQIADRKVSGNHELLRMALVEILRNSIEFCEEGTVSISIEGGYGVCQENLSAAEQFYATECRFGLCITDDGPGIPREHLPYILDPFFTTKAFGVGLGLTKAKRILCDELGGSMLVDSSLGEGTSVTLSFARC